MRKWIMRLFILSIFTLGIGLICVGIWQLWRLFKRNPLVFSLVTVGLIITILSAGLYSLTTINLTQANNTLDIQGTRFYIDDGLLASTHYMQYDVRPSVLTEPDTVYQVKVDNGIVNWADKMYWTELELATLKPKLVKHKISELEYSALSMNPMYSTIINEVRSEYNFTYLMIPLTYIGIIILAVMFQRERKQMALSRV